VDCTRYCRFAVLHRQIKKSQTIKKIKKMKKAILLIAFVCISIMANAQWQLTGNAGTNPATDFVGTTDNTPLIFRILGAQAGKLSFPLTSFGANSGLNITTANGNSFYGVASGQSTNSGSNNCFFGDDAGNLNTSGTSNNYFGKSAGRSNISGISNCFFGSSAGLNNTASNNSFFGHISGASNTTGAFNSFFGVSSGFLNTTGNSNSFFGANSGTSNTTGIENAFFGFQSGQNTSSGFSTSAFGSRAGNNNTTGAQNTFIGSSADCSTGNLFNAAAIGAGTIVSASNSVVLGNNANVGIGVSAPLDKLHVVGNIRMVDGNQAAGKVLTSDANGKAAWQAIPPAVPSGAAGGDLGGTYPDPTVVGLQGVAVSSTTPASDQVLQFNGTSWAPASLPAASVDWKTTGNAGTSTTTNFIGTTDNVGLIFKTNNATRINIGAGGDIGIGSNPSVGTKLTVAGDINLSTSSTFKITGVEMLKLKSLSPCFGNGAGAANTSQNNLFIGVTAGFNNTTGTGNTYLGNSSGNSNTTGLSNTFVGFRAGFVATGHMNTIVGNQTALNLAGGDGNVFVGTVTASPLTSGSNNTIIGASVTTPTTLNNSIALGSDVNITLDNCAVIGNASVNKFGFGKTPAAANILEFQATTAKLTTGGVWTNASDRKLKDNITQLDKKEILEKINNLEVARWHYKADKEMKTYIGPFAKDFYTAFKTGDDSTISTIDPSGVALIGIQQLSMENKELHNQIEVLTNELNEIKKLVTENHPKNSQKVELQDASKESRLDNAIPNPASSSSTIKYRIEQPFARATIVIVNNSGAVIKTVALKENTGEIVLNVQSLKQGIYTYSLVVDDIRIDTKQFSVFK
jgi:trimeric autotransporter adhesin